MRAGYRVPLAYAHERVSLRGISLTASILQRASGACIRQLFDLIARWSPELPAVSACCRAGRRPLQIYYSQVAAAHTPAQTCRAKRRWDCEGNPLQAGSSSHSGTTQSSGQRIIRDNENEK